MVLLINVSNLRFGGGRTVAFNIIQGLKSLGHTLIVIAPFNCDYEKFESSKIKIIVIPEKYNLPWYKPFLGLILLPKFERKFHPDFVLSLGNIAFKTMAKQLVLIHTPYLVYPESNVWKLLSFMQMLYMKSMLGLIRRNLKYADFVFVQTQTMRIRLNKYFKINLNDIKILPNSISFTSVRKIPQLNVGGLNDIKLLFLSKYYPHKNFEILISLAKKIKEENLSLSISITLDKSDSSATLKFLERLERQELSKIIVNLGHVDINAISVIYEQHDGLFLPSLLESFSGTYIESMYFGRPIFTSNMDFAHEVCKDIAYYFDPDDADDILAVIKKAYLDEAEMTRRIQKGYEQSQGLQSWEQINQDLNQFIVDNAKEKWKV